MFPSEILRDYFERHDAGDLFYIIETTLNTNDPFYRTTFLKILDNAAKGYGIYSSEGTSYSLCEDWDYPDMYDRIFCFIGYYESSSISFDTFLHLIRYLSGHYLAVCPEHRQQIDIYINMIQKRYEPFGQLVQNNPVIPAQAGIQVETKPILETHRLQTSGDGFPHSRE